jgi:hypothetical protein
MGEGLINKQLAEFWDKSLMDLDNLPNMVFFTEIWSLKIY